MQTIRIRTTIDSETISLPELKPLVGKTVDIIVVDAGTRSAILPGTGDWDAAEKAARELRESGYDFDAWRAQRDCDLMYANEHRS